MRRIRRTGRRSRDLEGTNANRRQIASERRRRGFTYPEVACMSTSGQEGLLRQNIKGGRSPEPVLLRNEPTLRGDVLPDALPAAGCTVRPGAEVHSRVRLRADNDLPWELVAAPGGGTTWNQWHRDRGITWDEIETFSSVVKERGNRRPLSAVCNCNGEG